MVKNKELWDRYAKSGDPDELITAYMGLARSIAVRVRKRLPASVSLEDIEASAMQGLWQAITRFDVSKSVPFGAYARQIIQGQIYDHIRENDNESRSLRSLQKKVEEAESLLSHSLLRTPSDAEVAEYLGIEMQAVRDCRSRVNNAHVWSLESAGENDDGDFSGYGRNLIESDRKFYVPTDSFDLFKVAVAPWVKKERLLFALIYFEEMSLDRAAVILDIPHPQVCQMHYRMGEQLTRMINA